jgi:hypothetical protein
MDNLTTIITSLIGGGVLGHVVTWRERRVNSFKTIQAIYQEMIDDLKKEVVGLKDEVHMLKDTVKAYGEQCNNCPNFKFKNNK